MSEPLELTLKKIDAAVAISARSSTEKARVSIKTFSEAYRIISEAIRADQESHAGPS